eukprot:CAMPEP_0174251294 /NCGR_PEP_ID=MMETSP0439-20130205/1158_1 /TAXON_ID=0 /ORGANISM="Stereomyxa ramosa, Strain Chinc5" /LENGTH=190 /DNA_ID=CAMNT_0015331567 /DNA_START=78 /DNA_END=650 /DNA_ORIENTATION=-
MNTDNPAIDMLQEEEFFSLLLNEKENTNQNFNYEVIQESAPPAKRQKTATGETGKGEKQTKLVKNRKAAQQFRKRQKNHIQQLESDVNALSSENTTLKTKVEDLQKENKFIRDQLDYMRNFVMNALQVSFANAAPNVATTDDALGDNVASNRNTTTTNNTTTFNHLNQNNNPNIGISATDEPFIPAAIAP